MTEQETFAQWEKRMRLHNEHRWISTELNDRGAVIHAYCSSGEWPAKEQHRNDDA